MNNGLGVRSKIIRKMQNARFTARFATIKLVSGHNLITPCNSSKASGIQCMMSSGR